MPKPELLTLPFAQSLFFKEQRGSLQKSGCEGIAPIALYKRATLSDSLSSLMTGVIHSFLQTNALSLTKNNRFAQKTDEQIPNREEKLTLI